jgi:hypothetical protein
MSLLTLLTHITDESAEVSAEHLEALLAEVRKARKKIYHRADSREQAAGSRQQAAGIRQHPLKNVFQLQSPKLRPCQFNFSESADTSNFYRPERRHQDSIHSTKLDVHHLWCER